MVQETMFRTTMQNFHKYTSLKLVRKVSLKCTKLIPFCEHFQTVNNGCYGCCYIEIQLPECGFLNLNVNQGVITAKSFQNTINNCSGMVNLHVPKKWLFGEKFKCQSIRPPYKGQQTGIDPSWWILWKLLHFLRKVGCPHRIHVVGK